MTRICLALFAATIILAGAAPQAAGQTTRNNIGLDMQISNYQIGGGAAKANVPPKKPKEIVVVGSKKKKKATALKAKPGRQQLYPSPTCPQCQIKKD